MLRSIEQRQHSIRRSNSVFCTAVLLFWRQDLVSSAEIRLLFCVLVSHPMDFPWCPWLIPYLFVCWTAIVFHSFPFRSWTFQVTAVLVSQQRVRVVYTTLIYVLYEVRVFSSRLLFCKNARTSNAAFQVYSIKLLALEAGVAFSSFVFLLQQQQQYICIESARYSVSYTRRPLFSLGHVFSDLLLETFV